MYENYTQKHGAISSLLVRLAGPKRNAVQHKDTGRIGLTLKASARASAEADPLSRDSGRDMVFSMFMVFLMELAISASLTIGPGSTDSRLGLLPYKESCRQPNPYLQPSMQQTSE